MFSFLRRHLDPCVFDSDGHGTHLSQGQRTPKNEVLFHQESYSLLIRGLWTVRLFTAYKIMAMSAELSKICERLRCNDPCLTLLNLSSRNIGSTGAMAIARALESNDRCIILFLDNNHVSDSAAVALARVLARPHCRVEQLYLSYNDIGDVGATALAEVIRRNQTLKKLKITDNRIGQCGGDALAQACSINTTLKVLHLDGNLIEDTRAFALALRSNQSLHSLNLLYNPVGTKNIACWIELLEHSNCTLRELYVETEKDDEGGTRRSNSGAAAAVNHLEFWLELNRCGRCFWERRLVDECRSCLPEFLSQKRISPRVVFTLFQSHPEVLAAPDTEK